MARELVRRRRPDREALILKTLDVEYVESWDVDLDDRAYSVIVSRDPLAGELEARWHLSVNGVDGRVPSWEHLAAIGHSLRPGVPLVLGVPPRSWWINVAEGCLHLWELRDESLIDQWRSESRGDRPA